MDLDFYKKNGYSLFPDFFAVNEIDTILYEAKQILLQQFIFKKYTTKSNLLELTENEFNGHLYCLFADDIQCLMNCGKQIQHLISLHRISLDQKILVLLKEIGLEFPVISTRPVVYFNHPKLAKKQVFYKVDAHQDWRSMQGSLNSVVIWVPLVNINRELGALQVIPGSHLMGLTTEKVEEGFGMVKLSEEDEAKFISVEVKRGDVLLFSSFLVHRSGDNITESPRWSCHFRYNDIKEPTFIKRAYPHSYIYKPIDELITPQFPLQDEVRKIFNRDT